MRQIKSRLRPRVLIRATGIRSSNPDNAATVAAEPVLQVDHPVILWRDSQDLPGHVGGSLAPGARGDDGSTRRVQPIANLGGIHRLNSGSRISRVCPEAIGGGAGVQGGRCDRGNSVTPRRAAALRAAGRGGIYATVR